MSGKHVILVLSQTYAYQWYLYSPPHTVKDTIALIHRQHSEQCSFPLLQSHYDLLTIFSWSQQLQVWWNWIFAQFSCILPYSWRAFFVSLITIYISYFKFFSFVYLSTEGLFSIFCLVFIYYRYFSFSGVKKAKIFFLIIRLSSHSAETFLECTDYNFKQSFVLKCYLRYWKAIFKTIT